MSNKPGLWLHGASGRMGREIQKALLSGASSFRMIGGSARTFEGELFYQGRPVSAELLGHVLVREDVETILDFSTETANALLFEAIANAPVRGKAIVLGT